MNVMATYTTGAPWQQVLEWELDDDPVEMTSLSEKDTGVPGVLFVSTRQGRHGPRVKWYPAKARADLPFLTVTLEAPARLINHGVAPRDAAGAVAAVAWVDLNRADLMRFWNDGVWWTSDELIEFLRALRKVD